MGQNFQQCWTKAWPVIGSAYDSALAGDTAFLEDQHIFLDRNGYNEECFFTFSFSPICSEDGRVEGLFHPVIERTGSVLSERRTSTLRDLATVTGKAKSIGEAAILSTQTLASSTLDLPFVLTYMIDETRQQADLVATTGLDAKFAACVPVIDLRARGNSLWPLGDVSRFGLPLLVDDMQQRFGTVCCAAYSEPINAAFLLPISPPGLDRPVAVLVVGVSPRLVLDESYRGFYDMVAVAVTSAVTNARAYEEERKRAEALAALNRARTEFFSNVSHEFRTPLTLLIGPTEELLAMEHGVLPTAANAQISIVHRNALRLQKLVNALLDFSQIEAGRAHASYKATDLATLSMELASVFRSAVEKAGLQLIADCPRLPELIYVDREMWEKIVLNLISNAFKFTFEGAITITMKDAGEVVQLYVRDTGAGIATGELPHIFERFHRVEAVRARTHEGTGIGLALVQELVRLHGGSVTVESALGEGSTFIVTIPKGSSHLPIDQLNTSDIPTLVRQPADSYALESLHWFPAEYGEPVQRSVMASVQVLPGGRPRILLADDNADMRDYVSRLLGDQYAVEAVADGAAALTVARRNPPDLVLADVMMPGLDGFSLLEQLRADPATSSVPVILLSARAGEESRIQGIETGADDYMVKPFNARELLARVGAQLQMARLRLKANLSLRESEARLRAFLAASSNVIYRMSPDWSEIYHLDGRNFIADTKEPLRDWMQEYIPTDDHPQLLWAIDEAIRTKTTFELEHRVCRVDSTLGWASSRAIPMLDSNGAIVEWFGAATDITLRKEAEKKLVDADRRKDEFLAMLAHELRNPLAPIGAAAELLQRAKFDEDRVRSTSAVIGRQVRHMTGLIDDLLDVSRVTRGLIELVEAALDIQDVVNEAVEQVGPLIRSRGQELTVRLAPQSALVKGDKKRLVQVLVNILNNAAKYTAEGGHLALRTSVHDKEVSIEVTDDGIGMTLGTASRAFDLFTQAERSSDRSAGGLGLGLALVKSLVELHGGSVNCVSSGLGGGSTFTVCLPLLVEQMPPAGREVREDVAPVTPEASLRMLVVDDNVDAAEMLKLFLETLGHEVLVEHGSFRALEQAKHYKPEVCLLDIGLPEIDGNEVARRLRAQPETATTVLIAVTGYGQESDLATTLAAGFNYHLIKPVDIAKLTSILSTISKE